MTKESHDNLEQLLRQFVDPTQSRQMADDIDHGDRLFDAYSAPSIQAETLAAICSRLPGQYQHDKKIYARRRWAAIASVAAILLVGLLVLLTGNDDPYKPSFFVAAGEWPLSEQTTLDDIQSELSTIDEAIGTMDTSSTYEPVNPLRFDIIEIEEIEADTSNAEFWKG